MNVDTKRKYTSDEFLSMTDLEGRYELVSGDIYAMAPSPNLLHQDIVGGFYTEIRDYIRKNKGGCRTYMAPSDVKITGDTVVQPDVYVVCDTSKLDGKRCNGAPDWIIEIVSPSDARHDYVDKLALYSSAGVREYWIVDPENVRVLVYPLTETRATGIYTFDDVIPVGIYKDNTPPLSICIKEILQ